MCTQRNMKEKNDHNKIQYQLYHEDKNIPLQLFLGMYYISVKI